MKKYFSSFETYLLEKKMSSEDVYNNHYNDIEPSVYKDIVESDPTSKRGVNGKYVKWLLNLHKNGRLKKEDYYKATSYLKAFNDFQHKFPIKDINQIKTIQDLFKMVKDYVIRDDEEFENDTEYKLRGQFREVFKNDYYRVIIPKTLEASKYFGRDTEWCTTHENQFKNYTTNQNADSPDENCLFIMYNEDAEVKYQFHFESSSFMDANDESIHLKGFLNQYGDISKYLESVIGDLRPYYMHVDEYLSDYCKENNIKLSKVHRDLEYELEDINDYDTAYKTIMEFDSPHTRDEYKNLAVPNSDIYITEIEMDESGMDGSYDIVSDIYFLIDSNSRFSNDEYLPNKIMEIIGKYSVASGDSEFNKLDNNYYALK